MESIEEIQKQILLNEKLFDEINELKSKITNTYFIKDIDINGLIRYVENENKIADLKKQKDQKSLKSSNEMVRCKRLELDLEINKLDLEISKLEKAYKNQEQSLYKNKINYIYNISNSVIEKKQNYSIIFKLRCLKILDYYLSAEDELNKILEKEGSEKEINDKLCGLYEKKIYLTKNKTLDIMTV